MERKLFLITTILQTLLCHFFLVPVFSQIAKPESQNPLYKKNIFIQQEYILSGKLEREMHGSSPVSGARVFIKGTNFNVTSGSDGSFSFTINERTLSYMLVFSIGNSQFETPIKNEPSWIINSRPYKVSFQLSKIAAAPKDQDGDGIPDEKDKCPEIAGVERYNGCPVPDTDGDGVKDDQDKCPTVAGSERYQGCPVPDKDGDALNDEEDKCPDVPGLKRYNGCPIPDSDGDSVNDEEDKCIDEKGPAANHGCPVRVVQTKWNFNAKNKILVNKPNDEVNWNAKKILQKSLINERIIMTKESEKLIEKLNPGYKQKLETQSQTELILPSFPEIGEIRQQELQNEFENESLTDSAGTILFIEKSRQLTKLFKTTLNLIADTLLRERFNFMNFFIEITPGSSGLPMKKYETDFLNSEVEDFYDYYLDLALNNNLNDIDTGYVREFTNKVTKTLTPYLKEYKLPVNPGTHGPFDVFAEDTENKFFGEYNIEETDPRLMVFFYVFTQDLKTPKDSFWIYTLNESQYKRLLTNQLTFSALQKPTAKCQNPANVTAKRIDFSYQWYIVAVKRSAPDVIVAQSIIDAESILVKPDRPEINERFAVALYMNN